MIKDSKDQAKKIDKGNLKCAKLLLKIIRKNFTLKKKLQKMSLLLQTLKFLGMPSKGGDVKYN